MRKLVITQPRWSYERFFDEAAKKQLSDLGDIVVNNSEHALTEEELAERIADAEVVTTGWMGSKIPEAVMARAACLKLVGVLGGACASFPCRSFLEKGGTVVNTPGAIGRYVAEFTVGLILSMSYEIGWHDGLVRLGKQEAVPGGAYNTPNGWLARGLCRSTVGIIGCGNVAKHVIRFLSAFDCRILVFDPFLSNEKAAAMKAEKVELDDLLRRSDIITIHAAWTRETEGLLSREKLALLRDNCLVVNTARMPIVDEAALLEEVKKGRLRAALNLIPLNKIWLDKSVETSRNLLVSMGAATVADKTLSDMGTMLAKDIAAFYQGAKLESPVTLDMLNRMT